MSDREELVEHLCQVQHDAYEDAARRHDWSTQLKSRVPWERLPAANRATMQDSMKAVLTELERMGVLRRAPTQL